jgi:hypothetical protein
LYEQKNGGFWLAVARGDGTDRRQRQGRAASQGAGYRFEAQLRELERQFDAKARELREEYLATVDELNGEE